MPDEQADAVESNEEQPTLTYDAWITEQDESVQGIIGSHIEGLRKALKSERGERKDFEKQLREATVKLEAGSEVRAELEALSTTLETERQRADFYDQAHAAGVSNLRLAWIAAQGGDYLDRKGALDVDALKQDYPELFPAPQATRGNAGNGAGGEAPSGGSSMNSMIRQMGGR